MIEVMKYGLKIYNLSVEQAPPGVAYVGRPSAFGNPWSHKPGLALHKVATAEEAVEKFELYAFQNTAVIELARRHLRGKSLSCFCVPGPCHALVLMRLANE